MTARIPSTIETVRDETLDLTPQPHHVSIGLILQFAVFALVAMLLLVLAPGIPTSLKLLYIAGVMLTLKRFGGIVVLLTVMMDLAVRERKEFPSMEAVSAGVFAFVTLAVVIFVFHQRLLLQRLSGTSVIRLARDFLSGAESPAASQSTSSTSEMTPSHVDLVETLLAMGLSTLQTLMRLGCCVMAALLVVMFVPRRSEFVESMRQVVSLDPSLQSGSLLVTLLILVLLVISEVSWRQLSPGQARTYLRSISLKTLYSDLRMIVVRRLKQRRKQLLADKRKR
jgi:lysylphosphatidylglycerol synthetase-like protein (DUF2156 family)